MHTIQNCTNYLCYTIIIMIYKENKLLYNLHYVK